MRRNGKTSILGGVKRIHDELDERWGDLSNALHDLYMGRCI